MTKVFALRMQLNGLSVRPIHGYFHEDKDRVVGTFVAEDGSIEARLIYTRDRVVYEISFTCLPHPEETSRVVAFAGIVADLLSQQEESETPVVIQ